MKQTITINETPYEVRFSLRAIKHFEELAQKSITDCYGTWDQTIYFYSTLSAINKNFDLSFDEFIDYLDTHTDLLIQWQTMVPTDPDNEQQPATTDQLKKNTTLFGLWMLSALFVVCLLAAPFIFGIASILLSLKHIIKLIIWPGKKLRQLWKR